MKVLRQVETGHTLPFLSYQQRQENKAKLACLASEYRFRFCSQLCLYISFYAFPGNGAKNTCWRLPTSPAMTPADANLGWQYFMNHE